MGRDETPQTAYVDGAICQDRLESVAQLILLPVYFFCIYTSVEGVIERGMQERMHYAYI